MNINYTDPSGKVVGTYKYTESNAVQGGTPFIALNNLITNIKNSVPSGYIAGNALDNASSTIYGQLSVARFGQSFNVPVTAAQTLSAQQLQTIFDKITISVNPDSSATGNKYKANLTPNETLAQWLKDFNGTRFFAGSTGNVSGVVLVMTSTTMY